MGGAMRGCFVVIALVIISVSLEGKWVDAEVHHVVADDRGWDITSDVGSWSSGRVYRVGDILWFLYSAALEGVVELSSREEFESCNMSNPVKMYSDGLNKVTLDGEGTRYFTSSKPENCKGGLKLTVAVEPHSKEKPWNIMVSEVIQKEAAGPTPSFAHLHGVAPLTWFGAALLCFMALFRL